MRESFTSHGLILVNSDQQKVMIEIFLKASCLRVFVAKFLRIVGFGTRHTQVKNPTYFSINHQFPSAVFYFRVLVADLDPKSVV